MTQASDQVPVDRMPAHSEEDNSGDFPSKAGSGAASLQAAGRGPSLTSLAVSLSGSNSASGAVPEASVMTTAKVYDNDSDDE